MSYWTYYLAWFLLAYLVRRPWLLAGVLVFLLLRRWLPDPGALWRAFGRMGALRHQVALNPANASARRDLARIELDLRRPRAALALLEQARLRDPDDAEVLFLMGVALHRAGRHDEALAPLVRSIEIRPGLRYGEPYAVAGDALLALGRDEEALDAYERYAEVNHSDVGVHVQLARAHHRRGERAAASASIAQALATWRDIPGSLRRRSFGRWVDAQLARVWMLREPVAVAIAVALLALAVLAAREAFPIVRDALSGREAPAPRELRAAAAPGEGEARPGGYDAAPVVRRRTHRRTPTG